MMETNKTKSDLLTHEEEIELGKRIKEGDLGARNALCDANYRLVASIAKQYVSSGMETDDLIQAGQMGLIRAADKYDYSLGFRFSTYATAWIRQSITRHIAENGRIIRIPVKKGDDIRRLNKAVNSYVQNYGTEPTVEELSEILDMPENKVKALLATTPDAVSLDGIIGDDESTTLEDFVPDLTAPDPEEEAIKACLKDDVMEVLLSQLSEREREVIMLRFGIGTENGTMTLDEVSKFYGLTRERVRQIEKRALAKLRYGKSKDALRSYYDAA